MVKKPSDFDVIAAVASAPGRGGVGVVRISGQSLQGMAQQLCGKQPQPRHATLVIFRDALGQPIDQGILIYFAAPRSFTGEDVLELHGHGGPVVMQLLLRRCLELGARMAEPGEFSRRAFMNEKLDLTQAEALADLINASTAQAARSAMRSLSGEFSQIVHGLVERLIDLRMLVEATLDFPDEEIESDEMLRDSNISKPLTQLRSELAAILVNAKQGSLLRNGLVVVLAGVPNVGKSSLLNRLAGEERAIVTDIAGTTRDAVRESIQIEGVPLHIIDTAGLREPGDIVEKLGIERSWREIERADVILLLVDARSGLEPETANIATRFPGDSAGRRIFVHNKSDIAGVAASRTEIDGQVHVYLSALTGDGIDLLQDELLRFSGWHEHGEDAIFARERHLQALIAAGAHLEQAVAEQNRREICAEELRLAQDALSAITGEFTPDDLLGEIFSRFCIGK